MSEMLIKGMEMPKTGSRIIEINFRGEVFELFKTDNERGGFLKSRKLEAVELPEPHGDLKDADGILQILGVLCMEENEGTFNDGLKRAAALLKYANVILEASE